MNLREVFYNEIKTQLENLKIYEPTIAILDTYVKDIKFQAYCYLTTIDDNYTQTEYGTIGYPTGNEEDSKCKFVIELTDVMKNSLHPEIQGQIDQGIWNEIVRYEINQYRKKLWKDTKCFTIQVPILNEDIYYIQINDIKIDSNDFAFTTDGNQDRWGVLFQGEISYGIRQINNF